MLNFLRSCELLLSQTKLLQVRKLKFVRNSIHMSKRNCIVAVQLLSHVQLFVTPWTAAHQASLSFTLSQSLPKLMSLESVMLSNRLILCHPFSFFLQSFPASGSFPMSQLFTSVGKSIGALASVLPTNSQD